MSRLLLCSLALVLCCSVASAETIIDVSKYPGNELSAVFGRDGDDQYRLNHSGTVSLCAQSFVVPEGEHRLFQFVVPSYRVTASDVNMTVAITGAKSDADGFVPDVADVRWSQDLHTWGGAPDPASIGGFPGLSANPGERLFLLFRGQDPMFPQDVVWDVNATAFRVSLTQAGGPDRYTDGEFVWASLPYAESLADFSSVEWSHSGAANQDMAMMLTFKGDAPPAPEPSTVVLLFGVSILPLALRRH